MGIILQIWDLEYESTMSYFAVEKRSLSKKYFALEEIAEKIAPDLLEDMAMYKEKSKRDKDSLNSSCA